MRFVVAGQGERMSMLPVVSPTEDRDHDYFSAIMVIVGQPDHNVGMRSAMRHVSVSATSVRDRVLQDHSLRALRLLLDATHCACFLVAYQAVNEAVLVSPPCPEHSEDPANCKVFLCSRLSSSCFRRDLLCSSE